MPTSTRTFRVFVSSTFEDLKAERDALQRDVFPRLRNLCEENNARFQAIDLRWGVRDEAALDQQTMEICLREIERCQQTGIKPNFIVLLGERYGWRPLPARIEAVEFERVRLRATDADRRLIDDWYKRDDNAVPPEYLLKPRTGEFADKDRWGEVEQKLHRILREAARDAGLAPESLIKFEASATHQEILKGLGQSEEGRKHVFAFFRESAEGATVDPELEALEEDLRRKLPEENVRPFRIGEIDKLCKDVEESLKKVILDGTSRFTSRDALDLEIEAHDRFARDRCRIFVGRDNVLTTIADYLSGPERRPLVLHGESGSGKSAVLAKASEQRIRPGRVIRRFIGASPKSTSGHALLTSLCKQIAPGETPVDYYQLEKAFQERLAATTAEEPLVLFVDALDQLSMSDPARAATWLPAELPEQVKVVVSTTEGGERLPSGLQVPLERMTAPEGGQALDALLREARRTLQPWQREKVLAHFERCGLPLYLKLAAEESQLWRSFSPADACCLGEGIAGVLDTLFDRLAGNANHGPVLVQRSLGYLAAARYGLAEDEMLDVLTADDAVWNDFDNRKHHEVTERHLPVVVWSRLSLDLEPYLTECSVPGGTVIGFYHRQLSERVKGRFLAGAETGARHGDLARYFFARPAWLDEAGKIPDSRRAAELVFQQLRAQKWTEAEATLFDCAFLFAKVAAGMAVDLNVDYQELLKDAPAAELQQCDVLRLIQGALRLSLHVVANHSKEFASQIVGRLLPYQQLNGVHEFIASFNASAPCPWLRPIKSALTPPGTPLIRVLDAADWVRNVAVGKDGKVAISASRYRTVKVWDVEHGQERRTLQARNDLVLEKSDSVQSLALSANEKVAAAASADGKLTIWDTESGLKRWTIQAHTDSVLGVALSADGAVAASASKDHTLKVWDVESGRERWTLEGHTGPVLGVAVSADGKLAVSASADCTLKVWDLQFGRDQQTLRGHVLGVFGVAISADGNLALSASGDKTVKVWDLETGQERHTLRGHGSAVNCISVSADGKLAVSASGDRTLKVWDVDGGQEQHTLRGHGSAVTSVAVSGNGAVAVSASDEGTLKVWDLSGLWKQQGIDGHSGAVNGVAVSANAKVAISASDDQTLKVWELEGGSDKRTLHGHTGPVFGVAVSANGKVAVSASEDRTVRVWNVKNGEELRTLRGHSGRVLGVALSADGKVAVSASVDHTLKVWDVENGSEMQTLQGHDDSVLGVALSADGTIAVSVSADRTLKVWEVKSGGERWTIKSHGSEIVGVAVSQDGRTALTASDDRTLKVWDLEHGRENERRILTSKNPWARGVAMSADGGLAISVTEYHPLRVWDLTTGICLTTFSSDQSLRCCAVASRLIVTGDAAGRICVFALEAD